MHYTDLLYHFRRSTHEHPGYARIPRASGVLHVTQPTSDPHQWQIDSYVGGADADASGNAPDFSTEDLRCETWIAVLLAVEDTIAELRRANHFGGRR